MIMNDGERAEREKYFHIYGIEPEEEEKYLYILNNCHELMEPKIKVGSGASGRIVEMNLTKTEEGIDFSGSVNYSSKESIKENRYISGLIFENKQYVYVDMKVERLGNVVGKKTYTTLDKFKMLDNKIVDKTNYYMLEEKNDIGGKTK